MQAMRAQNRIFQFRLTPKKNIVADASVAS